MNFPDDLDGLSSEIENAQIRRAREHIQEQTPPGFMDHQIPHIHMGDIISFLITIQFCSIHMHPIPCPHCQLNQQENRL